MFMFHVALSLGLIALTAGSALYVFSGECKGKGTCFAQAVAILVILISLISSACTIYCGIKFCQEGNAMMCMGHGMKMQDNAMPGSKVKAEDTKRQ